VMSEKDQNLQPGNPHSRVRFFGGPCAIENLDHCLKMAESGLKVSSDLGLDYVFKACFDKDCRSSIESFHGIGLDKGLEILLKVKHTIGVPVITDVSWIEAVKPVSEVVDFIQIPAYLCRQTHLLRAVGETGLPVHLKKGQFIDPVNLRKSIDKLRVFGSGEVTATDRGTFFGYNELVNDFRTWFELVGHADRLGFDLTHSIQLPTGYEMVSGGKRYQIPHLARAAGAIGYDTIFAEFHDSPSQAKSDSGTVLDEKFLEIVLKNFLIAREAFLNLSNDNLLGFDVHPIT
jgi:2-dehydro-3-deoxyphosphooctonate aldolase (KDO 8-P synthase)